MNEIQNEVERLKRENEELRIRLGEARDTVNAIRRGEVDALVVEGPGGEQIFSLKGADHSYRVLIEEMRAGAVTTTKDGSVLFANRYMENMLETSFEKIVGGPVERFVHSPDLPLFQALFKQCGQEHSAGEIKLVSGTGALVPVFVSAARVALEEVPVYCLAVTDLTQQKRHELLLSEERLSRSIIDQSADAIVVCNEKGVVIRASFVAFDLVGRNCVQERFDEVFPIFFKPDAPEPLGNAADLERFSIDRVIGGESFSSREAFIRSGDGAQKYLLIGAAPLSDDSGRVIGGIVNMADISEKIRLERRLGESLEEKEVLLKEIHHRVKNNMQVISSLISLQIDELGDDAMREVLDDLVHRVRSMAMVHEKLYQSADLARIDFADYAQSLLDYLWLAYGPQTSAIRLALEMEPVPLTVNAAAPCGLILNELVGNALKHAFHGRAEGEVLVSLRGGSQGDVLLRVRDDGVGLPPGFDWMKTRSLGLRLVRMLAKQLRASVEISGDGGTEFTITFNGAHK